VARVDPLIGNAPDNQRKKSLQPEQHIGASKVEGAMRGIHDLHHKPTFLPLLDKPNRSRGWARIE
jgi:hypothetical protein